MANDSKIMLSRKKLLVSRRVMIVLASLVGTLTISSLLLLLMDSTPIGATPAPAFAPTSDRIHDMVTPKASLQTAPWPFIIIYESGDLEASAASLAEGRDKGVGTKPVTVRPPANFHFFVNAVSSKQGALDGELEVGSTWQRQEIGTPFAGWPDSSYYKIHKPHNNAVGICLAGDISHRPYSEAQVRTLVQLVQDLQGRIGITNDHVLFQWEIEPNNFHTTSAQKAFAKEFRRRYLD